jgi:hypothetical protein
MKRVKLSAVLSLSTLSVVSALSYHEGDMIYGGVDGQIRVVDPTNVLESPPYKTMYYVEKDAFNPKYWIADTGWDWWNLPEDQYGIKWVSEATLISPYLSPQLVVRDSQYTYFSEGADKDSFHLIGSKKHKHFAFMAFNRVPTLLRFDFQLVNAKDWSGNPLSDSPVYTIYFSQLPKLGFESRSQSPVPEPASILIIFGGLTWCALRKNRSVKTIT